MVAILQLQQMHELARTFDAHIKGQTSKCLPIRRGMSMWTQCSEQMIRALLIVYIADHDIILVVLGQFDQDMPLDYSFYVN